MPMASGHAIGNSNVVKAGVLFDYLRREVLPFVSLPLSGRNAGTIKR